MAYASMTEQYAEGYQGYGDSGAAPVLHSPADSSPSKMTDSSAALARRWNFRAFAISVRK